MQLLAVVNDILDLARVETGELEIDLAPVRVPEIVGELRHMIEGLAAAGSLHATIDCPADLPVVNADPIRLKEIIVNLVDNAVKYTPPGGRIQFAAKALDGLVEISICDSGVGIPEDVGLLIFEPFYRVKGIEPQSGQRSSGLGLALAKRLVEAQGGEISFTSEVNVGTTFTFTLQPAQVPVVPKASSAAVQPVAKAAV
jgi:two-component system phosphate regulon sensor histidine kinase PhoR